MKNVICLVLLILSIISCGDKKKNVLIIGDSISIGYTPFVAESLKSVADVFHNPGNAASTKHTVDSIPNWIKEKNWDVIVFNYGLHDLCYRNDKNKKDKINGKQQVPLPDYEQNLNKILKILSSTNAKIIFVNTTYIPCNEPGRRNGDELIYNNTAEKVMSENDISICDLHKVSIDVHKCYGKGERDVHYYEKGYNELAKTVVKAIKSEL